MDCAKRAVIFNIKNENAEGINHNFSSLQTLDTLNFHATLLKYNLRSLTRPKGPDFHDKAVIPPAHGFSAKCRMRRRAMAQTPQYGAAKTGISNTTRQRFCDSDSTR